MKLRNVLLLSVTGMVATSAAVWLSVDPAHATVAARPAADPPPAKPDPKPAPDPQPVVDNSHFQTGKTLMMEGRFGHAVLPAELDSESFLLVDVTADASALAKTAPPLDLAIAIDRSGSMKGKRLTNAFAAARSAVTRLRTGDVVSIITYNSTAEVLVSPTAIDEASRARILKALEEPKAAGETCISCAVDTSMRLLSQQERTDMVQRILLVSDGFADVGVRDTAGFRRLAGQTRRMGASITTIGVDVDFDERIMTALARESNGKHFFVEHPDALATILDGEMDRLEKTVANGAELVVDLAPGVEVQQVFDRANDARGSQVIVPLGAFATGDEKTLLLRLRVPRSAAGQRTVASVHLRYDDLAQARQGQCDGELETRFSTDPSEVTPLDALVSARVSQSETAEALEDANEQFREGNMGAANQIIEQQQMNMHMRKMEAEKMAPMGRMDDVNGSFAAQDKALDVATGGFAAAATPPTADPTEVTAAEHAGKKVERDNAQNAFDQSE
jgi:Ca-activated chloride channel family protein